MRIQEVRFKNLNSLSGEWRIDFTAPAYASEGIFAITGPTGAGKTTILDAICLALYGRTPRLERVTKSGNEVMTRQTGECFAEVTFEADGKRYCSHWSQHRARRRPGGELQQPRQEISDAASGEVLESNIRKVAARIESVTGMDYDRFTRSMLLAQGGFAVFLQASADERAPILEQITGTEIYSQISVRVHELRGEVQQRLKELEARLQGMNSLSPEEVSALEEQLVQLQIQDEQLTGQRLAQRQILDWYERRAKLESELAGLADQQRTLVETVEEFKPQELRLTRARQALELNAPHTELEGLRRQQATDRSSLATVTDKLPAQADKAQAAQAAMEQADTLKGKTKDAYQRLQPLLRRVRELDQQLQLLDKSYRETDQQYCRQKTALADRQARQQKDQTELADKQDALTGLRQQIAESRQDEALLGDLPLIAERVAGFTALGEKCQVNAQALEEAHRVQRARDQDVAAAKQQLEVLDEGCKALEQTRAQRQAELSTVLEERTLEQWRTDVNQLLQRLQWLDNLGDLLRQRETADSRLRQIGDHQTRLQEDGKDVVDQLSLLGSRRESLAREQGLLETQLGLLRRIESFDEARHQLEDGTPCPLCGATEHPFAKGHELRTDQTLVELVEVRKYLSEVETEIRQREITQANLNKDLQLLDDEAQAIQRTQLERGEAIAGDCARLGLAEDDPRLARTAERDHAASTRALDKATAVVQAATVLTDTRARLGEQLEQARQSQHREELAHQEAIRRQTMAVHTATQLEEKGADLNIRLLRGLDEIRRHLAPYGLSVDSSSDLPALLALLGDRRAQWQLRQRHETELDMDILQLSSRVAHDASQIESEREVLGEQLQKIEEQQRELEEKHADRADLFGDKDPDTEERNAMADQEAADQAYQQARNELEQSRREQASLMQTMTELEAAIGRRQADIAEAELSFASRLSSAGFVNEDDYLDACLPEEERYALSRQQEALATQQAELNARRNDRQEALETETARQLSEEPRQEIAAKLHQQDEEHNRVKQQLGGIRQRLKDHEELQSRQQETLAAIDAEKAEYDRWNLLHSLIGSADGKKYRNFAQGLTFEMMVGHANRQLQKMSDRYLLVRDLQQPLDLNVIDNYQAGEIRTTKNLSGGESFIVSLALALGLSKMSSRNVRVDSLFLDEGFGTLDEDALDTALETLSSLQQDGKLIGVISHVDMLKERISTQIQVVPHSGGRSIISGPGCYGDGQLSRSQNEAAVSLV